VVVLVSLIVTGVAFSIYRLNASYYYRGDAYLQQYQNLRVALYTISRDVRMAGNGYAIMGPKLKLIQAYTPTAERLSTRPPPTSTKTAATTWFAHADAVTGPPGDRAIFGVDGGQDHADSVTVMRAEIETGNLLGKVTAHSPTSVTLDEAPDENAVKPGDIVVLAGTLSGADTGVLLEVADDYALKDPEIKIKQNVGRFSPENLTKVSDLGFAIDGAYLFNFRDVIFVTYYLDENEMRLMADYHDRARVAYDDDARKSFAVAGNIEDLQVYYFYETEPVDMTQVGNTPTLSSTVLDKERVKAVAIGITSRSPYGDGPHNKVRPALFNRRAGTARDNHLRSTLVQTVHLRNFHL
jgi:hypothetical protein